MAERGVAPAGVVRSHALGRPRVTVRSHYGGPPILGLDGTGRAGRTPRAGAGEEPAVRGRKHGPEAHSRHGGAPRGVRPCAPGAAPQGVPCVRLSALRFPRRLVRLE